MTQCLRVKLHRRRETDAFANSFKSTRELLAKRLRLFVRAFRSIDRQATAPTATTADVTFVLSSCLLLGASKTASKQPAKHTEEQNKRVFCTQPHQLTTTIVRTLARAAAVLIEKQQQQQSYIAQESQRQLSQQERRRPQTGEEEEGSGHRSGCNRKNIHHREGGRPEKPAARTTTARRACIVAPKRVIAAEAECRATRPRT
mmetsp:Transcript_20634/g.58709  ORF Transcript_20634/g.58709 Transcript_20634/m.58709 type:complete len:202 (-) Transcript_20634:183-788(-)